MKNMLSRDTVFARPLCRYSTPYGPVSVFAHGQARKICLIRSEITGRIIGVTVAIMPSESRVQEEVDWVAVPCADNPRQIPLSTYHHPVRPQHEVNNDY